MPDQPTAEPSPGSAQALSTEIGGSLASVWARYVGARPTGAETQLEDRVVRWILAGGTSEFEAGMNAEPADGERPLPVRTMTGYKRESTAAVAKATRRKVVAMISDHNAKTGVATETFILDRLHVAH